MKIGSIRIVIAAFVAISARSGAEESTLLVASNSEVGQQVGSALLIGQAAEAAYGSPLSLMPTDLESPAVALKGRVEGANPRLESTVSDLTELFRKVGDGLSAEIPQVGDSMVPTDPSAEDPNYRPGTISDPMNPALAVPPPAP